MGNGGFEWPQIKNGDEWVDVATQINPITGIPICKNCWNNMHPKCGCPVPSCQCGCYHGRVRGLNSVKYPAKNCKENQELPDVGIIQIP